MPRVSCLKRMSVWVGGEYKSGILLKLEGAYSNSPWGAGQRNGLKKGRFRLQTDPTSLGHNGSVDVPLGRKRTDDSIARNGMPWCLGGPGTGFDAGFRLFSRAGWRVAEPYDSNRRSLYPGHGRGHPRADSRTETCRALEGRRRHR